MRLSSNVVECQLVRCTFIFYPLKIKHGKRPTPHREYRICYTCTCQGRCTTCSLQPSVHPYLQISYSILLLVHTSTVESTVPSAPQLSNGSLRLALEKEVCGGDSSFQPFAWNMAEVTRGYESDLAHPSRMCCQSIALVVYYLIVTHADLVKPSRGHPDKYLRLRPCRDQGRSECR